MSILRRGFPRGQINYTPPVDDFEAPTFPTGAGAITGTLVDGETLTYTPVTDGTGNPTPTSSVQWRNVSDDSVAATSLTIVAAEGSNLYVRETLTNTQGSAFADTAPTGVIAAASGDTTAPALTANTWDNAAQTGSFTSDEAGTMYLATYDSASGTPAPSGAGWAGTTLETFSSAIVDGANSVEFTDTSASSTATNFIYFVRDAAGNNSDPVVETFSSDTTAPVLTNNTWDNGAGTGSVDSDEAGTLYLATYDSASGTPTPSGAGWSGTTLETFTDTVVDGANSVDFVDTSASSSATNFTYFVRDAAGNNSNAIVETYSSSATSGVERTYRDQDSLASPGLTATFAGKTLGTGKIFVVLGVEGSEQNLSSVTIDGATASLVTDGVTSADQLISGTDDSLYIYEADCTSATGDIVVNFTTTGPGAVVIKWYLVTGLTAVDAVVLAEGVGDAAPWERVLDINTSLDDIVIGALFSPNRTLTVDTVTGVTLDGTVLNAVSTTLAAGSAIGVAAATPRTVRLGDTTVALGRSAAISLALR